MSEIGESGRPTGGRPSSKRLDWRSSSALRLSSLGIVAIGLLAALLVRLWYLQVVASDQLAAEAVGNIIRTVYEPAPRGRIYDAKGRELVGNRVVNVVTVDAFVLRDRLGASGREKLALDLARQFSRSGVLTKASALEEEMANPAYGPFDSIPLAYGVSDSFKVFLAERNEEFPGIEVVQRTVRVYPYGSLASHVLGYIDTINSEELEARKDHRKFYSAVDVIGKSGIELSFEEILRGVPGKRRIEVDNVGDVVRELDYSLPEPGTDVQLTIDIDLQALLEDELRRGLFEARERQDESVEDRFITFNAPAGVGVILNPQNGDVLAMASYPTYDPREFIGGISEARFQALVAPEAHAPLNNRAIQGVYSPGSTMKPITAYGALSTGMIGPDGFLRVDQTTPDLGYHVLGDCTGRCEFTNPDSAPNGDVDLRASITVSSDVYYYKLAEQFSIRKGFEEDQVQQTARQFGFGMRTGVALPYENAGIVPDSEIKRERHEANPEAFPDPEWRAGDTLNISIGQGDLGVNPLQLANAFTAFANGGTIYLPNIARTTYDPVRGEPSNVIGSRVSSCVYLPSSFSDPITDGMIGATTLRTNERIGTAEKAFSGFPHEAWPVAGKTGTVEVSGGKSDTAAFVGYGPVPRSQYLVAVLLEEAGFGGEAAAPVVRRVLEPLARGTLPEVKAEMARLDMSDPFLEVPPPAVCPGDRGLLSRTR